MIRWAAILLATALVPAPALAYRDGARFVEPVLEGGAGGRFFSGAPRDGYGCAVCHEGAAASVTVEGIPSAGWDPGATYDLSVIFPAGARSVGAVLEVASEEGDGVGDLELVPDAELEAADRCRDDTAAVDLAPVTGRHVARADACGATRARVRWTAPPAAVAGGVRLFVGAVVADDSGDFTGDAAVTLVRPLRARGAPEVEAGTLAQRCSAAPARTGPGPVWLASVVALVLGAMRPRRSRTNASSSRSTVS